MTIILHPFLVKTKQNNLNFMETIISTKLFELEKKLIQIGEKSQNPADLCNDSIEEIIKYLVMLREYVLQEPFRNQKEEIYFFKEVKPLFSSKLIFFKKVKKLETRKPVGSKQVLMEYYEQKLQNLYSYFSDNIEIYDYYRLGNKYHDDKMFIRNQYNVCPNIDSVYYEMDHRFSTSHDFIIATILANEKLQSYVENQIRILNGVQPVEIPEFSFRKKLKWSLSQRAGVEIIYAFHAVGAFNNGNVDIKEIAEYFQEVFDMEIKEFYKIYNEIKGRKGSVTKLLDLMKEELMNKIMSEDGCKV